MELAAGLPRESDRTGPLDPMGRAQAGTIRLTASIADQTLWRSRDGKTDCCCARCRRGRPDFSGPGTEPLELACRQPHADKISRHKLGAGDIDGLLALIERLRTRVEQKTGQPVQVISCYEAGYDGFWLDRKLKAEGVINHVMDPASIQVDRRARRVKTDAVDADALLRALMAFCRGEKKVCSMVRVPTRDEEDAKRLSREREQLIKERVRHVNRIKGLCATQGIYDYPDKGFSGD